MRPNVLIGGVLAGAGLAMMAGWVFQLPAIVRVFPGFLMVFDTALGFAIAGGALAAGAFAPALRRSVHSGAGLVLAALGALVLAQYAFDLRLGIDWPALHAWLPDPRHNPNPGRMSAATGAGFFLAGAAFMIVPRVRGTAGVLLVRYLTAGIAAIGLTAAVGQALNLADILDFYWLNQVSLPTALSFLLLALGLWFDWRGDAWNALRLIRAEDDRIALAGALLLAVCIAATGASILWIMLAHAEQSYAA